MPVVGKSGTIKKPVVIFDEGAPNPYANFITELAEEDGIVRVGFATLTKSGDGQLIAMTVVRLHLKKEAAWELCRGLRRMEDLIKRQKR
ncbi:hypothetical protein GOL96_25535 [Sinorhizobium medicae]|uniref:hypothetical protein n=1 Tax=Sinorhizobium TaxID=28105 RepID=UPI0012952E9F|nr:hypothetical protein [Sinorhizobium medicae]MDW9447173.1 hypothetical protein [Sinorhizobium meliloti]MDW9660062.1 hypothetical protein [Sinorhizobium meliloti]MDX0049631.1 hypothetical protein [Sinorhizobium meliloti]MDX0250267.1 hypothetical protein [Sinorhizobium meliloti]MDX1194704.1 hypothetical protein [Sinorhizobium medicae]